MITWKPGLVRGPDGPCRELPQRHASSPIFCTRDGVLRRRHFNAIDRSWRWDERMPVALDDAGRMGYVLDNWVAIERAIALAWCRRHPESVNTVRHTDGKPVTARHLAWATPEAEPIVGRERFRPLRDGYALSDRGRLRAPSGEATSGFWFAPLQTRMAAVRGVLLDLRAALGEVTFTLPPRLEFALASLAAGRSVADASVGMAEGTMWSYYAQAAEHATAAELRRVRALVAPDLWRLLRAMRDEPVLGGPLRALMEVVRARLGRGAFARSAHQYEQLRLARAAVVRL